MKASCVCNKLSNVLRDAQSIHVFTPQIPHNDTSSLNENAGALGPGEMSQELKSELENALRLLQIQNRSLRDRLKNTVEENERLKDQLSQHQNKEDFMHHNHDTDLLAENEKLKDDLSRLTSVVHVMEEREAKLASNIEEWQSKLSKAEIEAEEAERKIVGLTELVESLREQLTKHGKSTDTDEESLDRSYKEQYAELELRFQEYEMKYHSEREKAREEIGWLRQGAEELQRQLENAKVDAEREMEQRRQLEFQLAEEKIKVFPEADAHAQKGNQHESNESHEDALEVPSRASSPPGLVSVPLIPHHRRDPSYSSEIEPIDVGGGILPLPNDDLIHRIKLLERELQDSENTHRLRDVATRVLKAEISELQRRQTRSSVDLDYLKAVLVESFASGELCDNGQHILPVLGTLLQFSPQELERAKRGGGRKATSGVTSAATAIIQAFST